MGASRREFARDPSRNWRVLSGKRGISVPTLPCPSLVVYGNEFADVRGKRVAALYRSRGAFFPGLDHWQLVLSSDVRRTVADFLAVD